VLEPARGGIATPPPPHIDPEPPAARQSNAQVTAANNANYQAVEQCRDKMFISREICLNESCGKPGVRSHPLCVKHREEVRLREESKQQAR
jgi:serine/threonine-protein kinase